MTTNDIAAIRRLAKQHASAIGPGGEKAWTAAQLAAKAPALCDEVEQLRAALTKSREQAANLANENGRLVAENARVRQQRDEALAKVETTTEAAGDPLNYLIWSQHHRSWWGPNRSGYRSNPADAGRYTLAAAEAEMGRGCSCCLVPEVPVAAAKVIGATDVATKAAITQATGWAIAAGEGNEAYAPKVVTVELPAEVAS
ncbi:hypothetical protein AB0B48_09130 [Micromonospora sp. NPDC049089]|uniref:hypothetical protein n=1 Tax=Micromonospora sp. NPDC049089 TaxID=3155496 RepID=UPI0033C47BF7